MWCRPTRTENLLLSIEPEELKIPLDGGQTTSGLLYRGGKNRTTIILAHGAGAPQMHPFMRLFAFGLAERGYDVITFNFLYMEQRRKAPDPKAKLESCCLAVIDAAHRHKKLKGNRLVIGGKSMGGRIASQVAAANDIDGLVGLVFLGYPLHPPGKPEQMRDAHLPQIKSPMLFVQGSRDAFGAAEELRDMIKKHRLKATLEIVDGGDHSLKVPRKSGLTQDDVYRATMDKIDNWVSTLREA